MKKRTHLRRDKFYTFDIETTTLITGQDENNEPELNGIIWSGQFYDGENYTQVRDLQGVIDFIHKIEDENAKESPYKIACFIHNASYEYQFIKDFIRFIPDSILCSDERKIIAVETDQIVFRCSYRLSNQNLDSFLKNEQVPEEYRKSQMDYDIERYPWTPIDPNTYKYCKNDVVGLHLAIEHRLLFVKNGDINNLPLTSTGYVRKDARKAVATNKSNHWNFIATKLDPECYEMCKSSFRGGNTHANKMYVNKVMKQVGSKDMRSAYPAALFLYDYPQKFFDMKIFSQKEFDFYLKNSDKWAMLIEVAFEDIELKNAANTPVPYISISKCNPILFYDQDKPRAEAKDSKAMQVDNGRVCAAAFLNTIITEVDYKIICKQYQWKSMKITRVKVAKKKPIYTELKEVILKYFTNKTTLKQDVEEGEEGYDYDKAFNYSLSKALLNAIYGMTATDPCKCDYLFNNATHEIIKQDETTEALLDKFYESFTSFLPYQIGTYVTSYCRLMLQEGIDLLINKEDPNKSDLIYCDTDSIKFINPESHYADIEALNNERIKRIEERGAYIDYNGKRWHLGIYTDEGISEKFKTFGAKKYIYGSDDNFKITISGVNKKIGATCIKNSIAKGRLKSPFDISKGYVFRGAKDEHGIYRPIKQTSVYMDHKTMQKITIDGKDIYYGSNIAMYPASYTLGLTYEYELLLHKYAAYMQ